VRGHHRVQAVATSNERFAQARRDLGFSDGEHNGGIDDVEDAPMSGHELQQRLVYAVHRHAQLGFAAQKLLQAACANDASMVDDRHPIADHLHFAQQVGIQEHGHAAAPKRPNQVAHLASTDRIQRRRRFVEQD
jgi:hypothetical protein